MTSAFTVLWLDPGLGPWLSPGLAPVIASGHAFWIASSLSLLSVPGIPIHGVSVSRLTGVARVPGVPVVSVRDLPLSLSSTIPIVPRVSRVAAVCPAVPRRLRCAWVSCWALVSVSHLLRLSVILRVPHLAVVPMLSARILLPIALPVVTLSLALEAEA